MDSSMSAEELQAEKERKLQVKIDAIRLRNEQRLARFKEVQADAKAAGVFETQFGPLEAVRVGGREITTGMYIERACSGEDGADMDDERDCPLSALSSTNNHPRGVQGSHKATGRGRGSGCGRGRGNKPAADQDASEVRQREKENEQLRQEREKINRERMARQKTEAGGWIREWDAGKKEDDQFADSTETDAQPLGSKQPAMQNIDDWDSPASQQRGSKTSNHYVPSKNMAESECGQKAVDDGWDAPVVERQNKPSYDQHTSCRIPEDNLEPSDQSYCQTGQRPEMSDSLNITVSTSNFNSVSKSALTTAIASESLPKPDGDNAVQFQAQSAQDFTRDGRQRTEQTIKCDSEVSQSTTKVPPARHQGILSLADFKTLVRDIEQERRLSQPALLDDGVVVVSQSQAGKGKGRGQRIN